MNSDDEVLVAFVEESLEHLDGIVGDLIQIEENGEHLDIELVNQVFRTLHSIKGASGFFDLQQVQDLSHTMESILDCFRLRTLIPNTESVSSLLDSADLLTVLISDVEASKIADISASIEPLKAILAANCGGDGETSSSTSDDCISIEEALALIADEEKHPDPKPLTPADSSAPILTAVPSGSNPVDANTVRTKKDNSIRVNINLLDKLMVLAGELVLTRNELVRSANSQDASLIQSSVQSVNIITSELQETIMSTRMQTVGNVFNKFKRIVRDLSSKVEKSVILEITGEDVDMDKTIIEAIGDPLTHLVRNSIDHGIETPAVRTSNGKPEHGKLQLHAFHSAGQVVIEIIDDGAGINYERVKAKAIENGIVSREELDNFSEKEIAQLIFRPGFSTAEKLTDISGRGVGMDVVQRNLSKVGGIIDLESAPNKGTKICIKLPLTLAIIPSLLVQMGDRSFAIPQINLVELVRIVHGDERTRLETIGDSQVLRIRGSVLPVVSAQKLFDLRTESATPATLKENELCLGTLQAPISIAVVAAGNFKYGIIVDKLLESAEIVVKPLGKHFAQSREYAGATILGDGSVALILDIAGMKTALKLTETSESSTVNQIAENDTKDQQSLLILENSSTEHFAIPSHFVSRIEKMSVQQIQRVGNAKAINYLGGTLQLVSLDIIDGINETQYGTTFYTVVVNISGLEVGIIAAQVRDIITITSAIDDHSYARPCVMGSFTSESKIIQLLDLRQLVKQGAPNLFKKNIKRLDPLSPLKILLVEDSPFFQRQISSALELSEFETLIASDGLEGLEVLKNNHNIDLVISDIEMPNMNGLEFARAVRNEPKWSSLPMIALTSLSGEDHRKIGLNAGFTEYQAKLDHDILIEACVRLGTQSCDAVA